MIGNSLLISGRCALGYFIFQVAAKIFKSVHKYWDNVFFLHFKTLVFIFVSPERVVVYLTEGYKCAWPPLMGFSRLKQNIWHKMNVSMTMSVFMQRTATSQQKGHDLATNVNQKQKICMITPTYDILVLLHKLHSDISISVKQQSNGDKST